MQIVPDLIKSTPKNMDFNFCVWGNLPEEIKEWSQHWGLKTEPSGKFTNIIIGDADIEMIFESPKIYKWVDGFSPNLNKHLHLGHVSNLIVAKSFQSLGVGEKFVAILGDTLSGSVDKNDALDKFKEYCQKFGYDIDDVLFASNQSLFNQSLLVDGEGEYLGTKVFKIGDSVVVGIKSNGNSTYFYQDVALAEKLNAPTLYLTGFEQNEHFDALKKIFPHIDHIGLGLVTVDGKKMSSSEGNVIMANEVFDLVNSKFDGDEKLSWNVLAGHILKYAPKSVKDINLKGIDDVKSSHGLYLSYTLAKMKSAGVIPNDTKTFNSNKLKFKLLKAKWDLSPNTLFEELVEHAKYISHLYPKFHIKGNSDNKDMFQPMVDDLLLGMRKVGMFDIDKV